MKLLHLDSSILGQNSVSRQLTAAVVEAVRAKHADVQTSYRDLAAQPIAHLSGEIIGANFTAEADWTETQRSESALSNALIEEFLATDVLVIGAPMYNFSIPSQLKSWIDRVAAAGRTFKYGANGPEGLAGGKKVVIVSSRGGVYSTEQGQLMDFQEDYLRTVLGFLGITDIAFIRAEAVNMGEDKRATAIHAAKEAIAKLAI
ncbi:FMN-dependent NADH-azoreductase [Aquitalea magnusonii]|jgi:FMN-dependent NADH-azoreductase|uniref:FMN-dependent NADH-azoreductase n=1 Tax=Aquitalea TaxID=407217 RepID=UPI0005F7F301|nr:MULTISPECIES: FMN-dependent NADH-azoreductase [Aquitalea]KJV27097.1 FMN-dependent NADH-azoreductase [Aquitalea magnusonii]QBJ78250.1 FMN-dependent NADH-azoreductase [Aquitalea sp. USM4]